MPVDQGSADGDIHPSLSREGPHAASSRENRTSGHDRIASSRPVRESSRPARLYNNAERTNEARSSQSREMGKTSISYTVADRGSSSIATAGEVNNSRLSQGQSYTPKSDTPPYVSSEGKTSCPPHPPGEHIPIEEDGDIVMFPREKDESATGQDARLSSRTPRTAGTETSNAGVASGYPGTQEVPMQPGLQAHSLPPRSPEILVRDNEVPPVREGDSENKGYDMPSPAPAGGSSYFSRMFHSSPRDKPSMDKVYAELEQTKYELGRAKGLYRNLDKTCRELVSERDNYKDQLMSTQNELRIVHSLLEDSRQLSETRGKELLGAQVFLTKADLLSESEVIQKVNDLNDEILQTSALLSESLVHAQSNWISDEEKDSSWRRARSTLGEHMLRTVAGAAQEPFMNSFLAQLTLQVFLTSFCKWKLNQWYEGDESTNKFMKDIYKKIRSTEEQAVSGRWRAITHANTRLSTDEWAGKFLSELSHVLALANWDWQREVAHSTLDNKLKPIFKGILDLRIALGEHFTSADISPFIVQPEAPFDPQNMKDGLSDDRNSGTKHVGRHKDIDSVDIVVATLGMGLLQHIPRGTQKGTLDHQMLLMPSVVLQSTLMELLQPPPPRKSKSASRTTKDDRT